MFSPNKKTLREKLLTKETSISNPSFGVYYGEAAAGSIPFHWESQPGTPKHPNSSSDDHFTLPPLTPPPSYFSYSNPKYKKRSKSQNLLHNILPKLINLRRTRLSNRSSSSSSSCSSSDQPCSPAVKLSYPKSYFPYHIKDREIERDSHGLMLCFGAQR